MTRPRFARGRRPERGIALLLVVWLLALFTAIAAEFMASARVKAAAEHNKRDDLEALALALAGYRAAVAALDESIDGIEVDADGVLRLRYRSGEEAVPAAAAAVPLGGGSYSWRIGDEDGLVNINKAQRPLLVKLLEQCDLESGAERDTIVDSILDWRDANREHRINGAEEDFYRGLDPAYSCKDGPFDTVGELLLVRGVTRKLFVGGEGDGRRIPGLRELVSVRAPEPPNVWTAPQAVLDASGLARPAAGRPAALSRHFAIDATGAVTGSPQTRSVRAVVRREEAGGRRTFTLLYWDDTFVSE